MDRSAALARHSPPIDDARVAVTFHVPPIWRTEGAAGPVPPPQATTTINPRIDRRGIIGELSRSRAACSVGTRSIVTCDARCGLTLPMEASRVYFGRFNLRVSGRWR